MKRRTYTRDVDYGHHAGGRQKMAHYLKTADGGFKQIGGNIIPARRARRYRLLLVAIALILTMTGLYHALL